MSKPHIEVLREIIDHHSHRINMSEAKEAIETLKDCMAKSDDFCFDFDGNEYRIISESSIWGTYVEEIKNIVEDCYDLKLDSLPNFIAFEIDWEQTAKNCYSDGYGHTFSTYDESELEVADWWIFRTN